MIVRKLKYYRMKARIPLSKSEILFGISHNKIYALESLEFDFREEELEALAKFFKTTKDEINKLIDMDVKPIGSDRMNFVVNRMELTEKETEEALASIKESNRIRQRNFVRNRVKKVREDNNKKAVNCKPFKCLNQACRLNSSWTKGCNGQECMCNNPVVIRGSAPCYGRNKVQDKPKKQNFIDTKSCFMADAVSKGEKEKHYAL